MVYFKYIVQCFQCAITRNRHRNENSPEHTNSERIDENAATNCGYVLQMLTFTSFDVFRAVLCVLLRIFTCPHVLRGLYRIHRAELALPILIEAIF